MVDVFRWKKKGKKKEEEKKDWSSTRRNSEIGAIIRISKRTIPGFQGDDPEPNFAFAIWSRNEDHLDRNRVACRNFRV